jgi:outer membrane protein OmpA-like peptidoglycan-associated protein
MRQFTIIILLAIALVQNGCKSTSQASGAPTDNPSVNASVDVEAVPSEADTRSVAVGEPQNNSAVGLIIGSTLGGEPGIYISKQMDIQAEEIGKTELEGARILRVGEGIKITFDGSVMFAKNSARLSATSQRSLKRVGDVLVKYPHTKLVIEGHTDGSGSAKHNKALSAQRANAVAKYLAQQNVDQKRVSTTAYGEEQPLFSNDTEKGRMQNRRVELIIIADDEFKAEAKSKYK